MVQPLASGWARQVMRDTGVRTGSNTQTKCARGRCGEGRLKLEGVRIKEDAN